MKLLAHGGIDHGSTSEAAMHSTNSDIVKILLISLVVIAFAIITVLVLKKLSIIKVPIYKKEEK